MTRVLAITVHRVFAGWVGVRFGFLAVGVAVLLSGCVTVPPEAPESEELTERRSPVPQPALEPEPGPEPAAPEPVAPDKDEIIKAGLFRAVEAFKAGTVLRPYAAVYSNLGGLRPVRLNDKNRQASDSDTDLLLESIRALGINNDLKAFAVFGLAEDNEGQRWFVVHYETRRGEAELRQYPVPPPAEVDAWEPVKVEPSQAVIF